MFCERYLATGHHVEVQVLADEHGTVWAVGERECSIQRRHQKIIEEAPSPLVERTPGMRAKLFDAARLAATAIGYTGAGTVEFMADDTGDFFFLEMNTRLQVEHPVTELTTGTDLVELQLHVADGGRLDTEPPPSRGYSIEARLYAEDPAKGWQPQAGTVHRFDVPAAAIRSARRGVRVDTGIVSGSTVSIFYDPMLAKVISYAPSAVRPPASSPTRWPAPASTACAPTGTCWSTCCGIRRSSTAPPIPRSSTPTAWPSWPRRWRRPRRHDVRGGRRARRRRRNRCRNGIRGGAEWLAQSGIGVPVQEVPGRRRWSIEVRYRFTRGRGGAARHDNVTLVSAAPTTSCWPSTAWSVRSTWPATA